MASGRGFGKRWLVFATGFLANKRYIAARESSSLSSAIPLLTDFYQVTMSYGYWKTRRMEMPAVFPLLSVQSL